MFQNLHCGSVDKEATLDNFLTSPGVEIFLVNPIFDDLGAT